MIGYQINLNYEPTGTQCTRLQSLKQTFDEEAPRPCIHWSSWAGQSSGWSRGWFDEWSRVKKVFPILKLFLQKLVWITSQALRSLNL